jgi:hypothetical protein
MGPAPSAGHSGFRPVGIQLEALPAGPRRPEGCDTLALLLAMSCTTTASQRDRGCEIRRALPLGILDQSNIRTWPVEIARTILRATAVPRSGKSLGGHPEVCLVLRTKPMVGEDAARRDF